MSNPGNPPAVVGTTPLRFVRRVPGRAVLGSTAALAASTLLVLLSLSTVRVAAAQSGGEHHHHPSGPSPCPSPTTAIHDSPGGVTPEQRATADRFLAEVRAAAVRFAEVQAAEAEGYRRVTPFLFGTWRAGALAQPRLQPRWTVARPSVPRGAGLPAVARRADRAARGDVRCCQRTGSPSGRAAYGVAHPRQPVHPPRRPHSRRARAGTVPAR